MDTENSKGERIAFRSTRGQGRFAKSRWTELAIYHDPDAMGGNVFTAETRGCSTVEGEVERVTRLRTPTLDRALAHFDGSVPSRIVAEQARAWLERNEHAEPAAQRTYTDNQYEAAVVALSDADQSQWGWTEDAVVAVAAALGMTRETARG